MMIEILDGDGHRRARLTTRKDSVEIHSSGTSTIVNSVADIEADLTSRVPRGLPTIVTTDHRPWPQTTGDALTLIALSGRWPAIVETTNTTTFIPHHVTLSFALPLYLDRGWRTWAEHNIPLLIESRQLVPVPASDLVAAATIPASPPSGSNRRLARRHADTLIKEHSDLAGFMDHWARFVEWRYQEKLTPHHLDTLSTVFTAIGAVVREFVRDGEVIARTVVCIHYSSKTVFDMIATWEDRHSRHSPGVWSGLANLADARRRGYHYSLCYGQFPYKDRILDDHERISLEDLRFDLRSYDR